MWPFPHRRKMISTHLILMHTHILIHTHTHLNRLALMDAQLQDENSRRVTDFKAVLNERIFFTGAVIHSYLSSITPVPSVPLSPCPSISSINTLRCEENMQHWKPGHFCNLNRCIVKQKCLFISMESEHIWYGELWQIALYSVRVSILTLLVLPTELCSMPTWKLASRGSLHKMQWDFSRKWSLWQTHVYDTYGLCSDA